ncbi:MAG: hypothetical protein D6713_08290, partial [Deltaproteobacteria bacterium]
MKKFIRTCLVFSLVFPLTLLVPLSSQSDQSPLAEMVRALAEGDLPSLRDACRKEFPPHVEDSRMYGLFVAALEEGKVEEAERTLSELEGKYPDSFFIDYGKTRLGAYFYFSGEKGKGARLVKEVRRRPLSFREGALHAFLRGLVLLGEGDASGGMRELARCVSTYPGSQESERAWEKFRALTQMKDISPEPETVLLVASALEG